MKRKEKCLYEKYGDCTGCQHLDYDQYAEGWMHKRYYCRIGRKEAHDE